MKTSTITASLALAFAASAYPALADDAFIESSGKTMTGVNSRYFWNMDSRVEIDFAFVGTTAQQRLFGADKASPRVCQYINGEGRFCIGLDKSSSDTDFGGISFGFNPDTERHTLVIDQKRKESHYITDGVTNKTVGLPASGSGTQRATIPIALFGSMAVGGESGLVFHDKSASMKNSANARIYRARFWTNDVLVHDYVPCMKGCVAGFKDLIDGEFVTANNPSVLTAGGDYLVEPDDGYIESADGSISIDTGYMVGPTTRIDIDFAFLSTTKGQHLFGGGMELDAFAAVAANSNILVWSFQNTGGAVTTNNLPADTARHTFSLNGAGDEAVLVTSGFTNIVAALDGARTSTCSTSLKLLADTTGANQSKMRIYSVRIWESGSLTHDYAPFLKHSGVAGLKDAIGGGFITCDSSKLFTYGGGIEGEPGFSDAYLESDGTQAIKTGYFPCGTKTVVEADFAFTKTTTQMRVFGAYDKDSVAPQLVEFYIDSSSKFAVGRMHTDKNSRSTQFNVLADTLRHSISVDLPGKSAVLDSAENTWTVMPGTTSALPLGIFAKIQTTPADASESGWVQGTDELWYRYPAKMRLFSLRIYEWEDGVKSLKHEFVPCVDAGVPGLYDTRTGAFETNALTTATAFAVSGKGVDGAELWLVRPQGGRLSRNGALTLTANAAGALSYKWTLNGEAIEGGADGSLSITAGRSNTADTYGVTPIYSVFGVMSDGEEIFVEVENLAAATVISLK